MVKISSFLPGLALQGTLAAVIGPQHSDEPELMAIERRQGASYFQNWSEGGSNIRCQQKGNGFSANWNSRGGFVCGLGWRGSGSRTIKYSGTYEAKGPGYLAIYGWTKMQAPQSGMLLLAFILGAPIAATVVAVWTSDPDGRRTTGAHLGTGVLTVTLMLVS